MNITFHVQSVKYYFTYKQRFILYLNLTRILLKCILTHMSNALVVNKETGFLESPSPSGNYTLHKTYFNSAKKLEFLNLVDECISNKNYPSLHNICETLDIGMSTFEWHMKNDRAFNAEWTERKIRLRSLYTVELGNKAMSKMGTLANLAMLRYLESGTWLPETRVNHVSDSGGSKPVFNALNQVVDGEIVIEPDKTAQALPSQGEVQP